MEKLRAVGIQINRSTSIHSERLHELLNNLKPALQDIERRFTKEYFLENDFSSIEEIETALPSILDDIIEDEIHVYRILAILVLFDQMINMCIKKNQLNRVQHLIYIIECWMNLRGVHTWIQNQGGWRAIEKEVTVSRRSHFKTILSVVCFCLDIWINHVIKV